MSCCSNLEYFKLTGGTIFLCWIPRNDDYELPNFIRNYEIFSIRRINLSNSP